MPIGMIKRRRERKSFGADKVDRCAGDTEYRRAQRAALDAQSSTRSFALSFRLASYLFKAQVGISVKRYLLWRKLHHAITIWAAGPWDQDMTTLAHMAGFSDLAHFSRTAATMIGQTPSYLRPQNSEQLSSYVQA